MSRTKARKMFSIEDHVRATEGVECRKDAGVIDETPMAYKDIDDVMAAQSDLLDVVHRLKQVLCVKGWYSRNENEHYNFGQRWIRKLSTLRLRAKYNQNNSSRDIWLPSLPTVHLVPRYHISCYLLLYRGLDSYATILQTPQYSYSLFSWPEKTKRHVGQYFYQSMETCKWSSLWSPCEWSINVH